MSDVDKNIENYAELVDRRGYAGSVLIPDTPPIFPVELYSSSDFHFHVPHVPIVESSNFSGTKTIPIGKILESDGKCLFPLLFFGEKDEFLVELDCKTENLPSSIGDGYPRPFGYLGFLFRQKARNVMGSIDAFSTDMEVVKLPIEIQTNMQAFLRVSLEKAIDRSRPK